MLEFSERPDTPEHFAEVLDRELRSVNSDYDAKRQTALDPPRIHAVPPGTTLRWLQKTGKNKLPRMRNDRTVFCRAAADGGLAGRRDREGPRRAA